MPNIAAQPKAKEPLVKVDREKYQPGRSASGTKSLNNGDEVAKALEGLSVEDLYVIADKIVGENEHRKKYTNLNTGMQRMNLGNRIRGAINKIDKKEDKTGAGLAKLQALTAPIQKKVQAATKAKVDEKKAKADAKKKTEKKSDK